MFTSVYSGLPVLTLFSRASLRMFTHFYSSLPTFTLVYTFFTRVYLCLLVLTYIYHCVLLRILEMATNSSMKKGPYLEYLDSQGIRR